MSTLRFIVFAFLVAFSTPNHSVERKQMSLEELQTKIPFSSWAGHVNSKALDASREIYKTTLSKLVQIGIGKPKDSYIPVLSKYIEDFNRIDERYEFIETIEREDICEHLGEILAILKLPGVEECDDLPVERNW
ncbi:MAG TPA: hypothetical protein VGO61_05105 [Steroidobacteraceae bacterium]|jgi:hypothetical protein|nr:hypothetical protein [Steroidobacteraceae bacterium]